VYKRQMWRSNGPTTARYRHAWAVMHIRGAARS